MKSIAASIRIIVCVPLHSVCPLLLPHINHQEAECDVSSRLFGTRVYSGGNGRFNWGFISSILDSDLESEYLQTSVHDDPSRLYDDIDVSDKERLRRATHSLDSSLHQCRCFPISTMGVG